MAADEGEIVAQLQQEGFQVTDQRLFEVALRILVLEVEEFQNERVFDLLLGPDAAFGPGLLAFGEHRRLVAG